MVIHALLVLTKSKIEVVQEQKTKDISSKTSLDSSKRIALT